MIGSSRGWSWPPIPPARSPCSASARGGPRRPGPDLDLSTTHSASFQFGGRKRRFCIARSICAGATFARWAGHRCPTAGGAPPYRAHLGRRVSALHRRATILRRIAESLGRMSQVKIVLISETTDLATLNRFINAHQNDMPRVEQYQSIDERLRGSQQNNSQPTTLLVDALGVVRQAFLGSLKHRRSEFVDAISRMSRAL